MKKRIMLCLVMLFALLMKAQENKTINQAGVSTSIYFIDGTYRALATPKIVIGKSNHKVSAAPTILFASDVVSSDDNFPKLTGFQLEYHYLPNITSKRLNFFLYSQLTFQMINDSWSSVTWESTAQRYIEYKYINKEHLTTVYVGYGIQFAIGERLLVNQSVGIGGYYSVFDGEEVSVNAPEIGDDYAASYKPLGISYVLNFGLNYKL